MTDASRHWVEIQLPQGATHRNTVGFYVVGHTDEIERCLHPVLMGYDEHEFPDHDYIPCDIIAVDNIE